MTKKRPPGPSSKPPGDRIILVTRACRNRFSPQEYREFAPAFAGNCRTDQLAGMAGIDGESQWPSLAKPAVAHALVRRRERRGEGEWSTFAAAQLRRTAFACWRSQPKLAEECVRDPKVSEGW